VGALVHLISSMLAFGGTTAATGTALLEFALNSPPHDHVGVTSSGFKVVAGPGECPWEVQVFGPGDKEQSDNLLLPLASEWENWNGFISIQSWVCPYSPATPAFPPNTRRIPVRSTPHVVQIQLLRPQYKNGVFTSGRLRVTWYE
jgi:hypothetical protein